MHNPIDPETHLRNLAAATERRLVAERRASMHRDRSLHTSTRRVRFRRG